MHDIIHEWDEWHDRGSVLPRGELELQLDCESTSYVLVVKVYPEEESYFAGDIVTALEPVLKLHGVNRVEVRSSFAKSETLSYEDDAE